MSDLQPHLPPQPHPHRKRVIAREVDQVEAANRDAAAIPVDIVINSAIATPPIEQQAAVVVDPTTLGRRHRRSSHHRIYRGTQGCSMLGALLAAISVICTMADDLHLSRWLAGPALGLTFFSIALSGQTSLSARWRGWAIASTVFAAVALSLTWLQPMIMGDDSREQNVPRLPRPPASSNP
jgi:hypothetical protein